MRKFYLFFLILITFICHLEGKRINFLHIPKTGGTTLHYLFLGQFPVVEDWYPHRMVTPDCINSEYCDQEAIIRDFPIIAHKIVSGHFPFWFFQNKDPDFDHSFFVTILREPVDRVLSHHQFWKGMGLSLSPLDIPSNLLCKLLCSDSSLSGEELLQNSIKNLQKMDCIIFFENFDRGVKKLFQKLNLAVPHEIPKYNASTPKQTFDEQVIQQIRELNSLDIRLYKYAKERYSLDPTLN